MYKNIIFIGGIHGVGKSTYCQNVIDRYAIVHISCSSVLKWQPENIECSKSVKDISKNQNQLVLNLKSIIQPHIKYILDGHFCLLKNGSSIEKISLSIFQDINPVAIAILSEDIKTICKRLEKRDDNKYSADLLDEMHKIEMEHGSWVANKLNIPFFSIQNTGSNEFKEYLDGFTCTN